MGGEERGYDGGKKIEGRKRHLLVDTEGFLLKAKAHAADIMDRDGIKPLPEGVRERFPRLSHLWLDAGCNGKGKGKDWVEEALGDPRIVSATPGLRGGPLGYDCLPGGLLVTLGGSSRWSGGRRQATEG